MPQGSERLFIAPCAVPWQQGVSHECVPTHPSGHPPLRTRERRRESNASRANSVDESDDIMTPDSFRKDKYLRATGYNFYVWAAVNLLVTAPLYAALAGRPWPPWLAAPFPLVMIGIGVFLCVLNDNRVQKMCGEASPEPVVEAAHLWVPIFLLGIFWTVIFSVRGPAAYIQPLWLLLVGAGYLLWGNFTVAEFRWLGLALILAGGVSGLLVRPGEIPAGMASDRALLVWVVFMCVLWVPFGAYVNWKYVHLRAPRA